MKRLALTLAALAVIVMPDPANGTPGTGAVLLAVDGCTGPIEQTVLPGQSFSIYASVLGQSQAATGYQVSLLFGVGSGRPLPDAWRFDASGCQGPARLTMEHLAPSSKTCPNFVGTAPTEQSEVFEYDPATGLAATRIAVRLTSGSNAPNPAQRYFLARWIFDHGASVEGPGTPGVSCGGLEYPICFVSGRLDGGPGASWTGTSGDEHPWPFQNEHVSTQGHPSCPCSSDPCPTPARNSTWGAIKGQYR